MANSTSNTDFDLTMLRPVPICCICLEPFSREHAPAALACRHIMGYECLATWIRSPGEDNEPSCPECRAEVNLKVQTEREDLWYALNKEPEKRLAEFVKNLAVTRERLIDPSFDAMVHIENALELLLSLPGDYQRDESQPDPFLTLQYHLDRLQGGLQWDTMLEPLHHLADMVFTVVAPLRHTGELFKSDDFAMLLWRALMGLFTEAAWGGMTRGIRELDYAVDAVTTGTRLFDLLHLFTVEMFYKMEETGAVLEMDDDDPKSAVEAVVRMTFFHPETDLDGNGERMPSDELMHKVIIVFQELRRHLFDKRRPRLNGKKGEEHFVRGLWVMATFEVEAYQEKRRAEAARS